MKEKLAKFLERIEKRKRNTEKAREELREIMDMISDAIPCAVSGYRTQEKFTMRLKWYNYKNNWREYVGGWFFFRLEGGYVKFVTYETVYNEYGMKLSEDRLVSFDSDFIDDITYINFKEVIPALKEFIENISEIATFEEEAKILTDIREAVEKVVNGDDNKKQIEKAG